MKNYTTQVVEKSAEETEASKPSITTFTIDGHEVTARRPSEPAIVLIVARTGRRATAVEVSAAALDFFFQVLDNRSARYIEDRLIDPEDPFDLSNVMDILFDLIEEWTGRPTERLSVSKG